ncbi:uncharacterized protein LOC119454233 [Dermacentor silvarum]|uniref:uncharacterized protein LOC119454233 n=1 Tax=Dermacentor silvarum TaxID=543639 RepID=UPI002100F26C|nr:uncharacterized protein LOC119454233 [Dermacentor silvarum]
MPDSLSSMYVLEKCDTSCPMVQLLNAKRKREEQGDLDPGPLDVHYEWEKEQIMFQSSTDPSSKLRGEVDAYYKLQVTSVVTCKTQRTTAWHKARACRITSTLAHRILRHRGPNEDLAEKIIRQNRITTAAMIYGIKLEPAGRAWFAYHENVIVHELGFVLKDSQPWLGCSPDGVIECPHSETELLEIKCPYSKRSGQEKFLEGKSLAYLTTSGGACHLKTSHEYYTQVQVALYTLGLKVCKFLVYTPKEQLLVVVNRCDEFLSEAIPKLEEFYFHHMLPKLAHSQQ